MYLRLANYPDESRICANVLFPSLFSPPADQRLAHEILRNIHGLSGARRAASQDVLSSPNQQVEQKRVADAVRGWYDDLGDQIQVRKGGEGGAEGGR